jgi:hypothetical protein
MSRKRRLLILTLVLAVAIPVGLDSMGKVFAGATGFLSNPGANGNHDGSGSQGPWATLQAAWRGRSHQPAPPQSDTLNSNSQGKRFDEAANHPNWHSDAPWIDPTFSGNLSHSEDFNTIGTLDNNPSEPANEGNSGNHGGPNGGVPTGGGEIFGGGPGAGGKSGGGTSGGTSNSTPTLPTTGDGPAAATPEPGTFVLFSLGLIGCMFAMRKNRQLGFGQTRE